MSGDVQPRKRKDKKKKKDDLGIEEPRGTAAVFGEGDVFMHSQHDHGTGGHWCAKVIFFSLLAVLITLIGLIILENRGLTELEANSVESRYSGVLEGWLEDAPDDDHHDEHTLDLKHHDDEEEDDHGGHFDHEDDDEEHDSEHDDEEDDSEQDDEEHDSEQVDDEDEENHGHDNDDEQDDEDDDDEQDNEAPGHVDDDDDDDDEEDQEVNNSEELDDNDDNDDNDENDAQDDDDEKPNEESEEADDNDEPKIEEQSLNTAEVEDIEEHIVKTNYKSNEYLDNDDDDDNDDDLQEVEEKNYEDNDELDDKNDESDEDEQDKDDEDEEEHEEVEEDPAVEVEAIEKEVTDDEVLSHKLPYSQEEDNSQEESSEASPINVDEEEEDVEFLEADELDELPEVLPIPVPKGKPLAEVEESSTIKPHDTLAEEEEYERQQEELRKEKEQASQGMWLKLTVGGALLVATHAVFRRATADGATEETERSREDTPLSDRRMTLAPEPSAPPAPAAPKVVPESRPVEKEFEFKKPAPVASRSPPVVSKPPPIVSKLPPPPKEEVEEEEEEEEVVIVKSPKQSETIKDKELYSDDEEEIEEEEIVEIEEEPEIPQQVPLIKQTPKPTVVKEPTPEPDDDDDVEIIDDEQLEEELEDEEDDISDVDDAELLSRLEAKYGRLPEPERPMPMPRKDGGNSIEDEWPGEPSDPYWRDQLDQAERELHQGAWSSAEQRASGAGLVGSARARLVKARALDAAAEAARDNTVLGKAIAAYLDLLKMNDRLTDKQIIEIANRTANRLKFRGNYLGTEPVYKLLIRRFPDDPNYRNNLTVSYLMANRADLAESIILETLKLWPDDRVALAHYGFILKTNHNKLEEAVDAFTKALEGDTGPACEPRFYYHLGDALLLLGRFSEAHEVHKRGAALGHFLSPAQRSLYNVDRLKSRPWWNVEDTPYSKLARALEKNWKEILKEGEAAKKLYEKEKEGLKERGEWSQLDLFVRGREVPDRCSRAPVTCSIVRGEIAASTCRRGQIKFSAMEAGTHVRPHVGPTNCRLRMHLGLSNTKNTYIRVDQETRQWQTGKVLMFDDSFEHEVWHNGTGTRLVLIVDVWHPDLTPAERRQLPAI